MQLQTNVSRYAIATVRRCCVSTDRCIAIGLIHRLGRVDNGVHDISGYLLGGIYIIYITNGERGFMQQSPGRGIHSIYISTDIACDSFAIPIAGGSFVFYSSHIFRGRPHLVEPVIDVPLEQALVLVGFRIEHRD